VVHDLPMCGKVGTSQGIEALRKDSKALCDWSNEWQMNFNVDKCKVLKFGVKNIKAVYKMGKLKLAEITEEKDLGGYN